MAPIKILPIIFYITFKDGGMTGKHSFLHLTCRMKQKLCVRFVVWRTVFNSPFCSESIVHIFATEVGKQWKQRQHIQSLLSVTVCHMHIIHHAHCPNTVMTHACDQQAQCHNCVMEHAYDPPCLVSQYCDDTCKWPACLVSHHWWHMHAVQHTYCHIFWNRQHYTSCSNLAANTCSSGRFTALRLT